jgi:hypothetical protein
MGYSTSRTRIKAILARRPMANVVAADQLKFVLDLIARCASIGELRRAIAEAGITAPSYYENMANIPQHKRRADKPHRRLPTGTLDGDWDAWLLRNQGVNAAAPASH